MRSCVPLFPSFDTVLIKLHLEQLGHTGSFRHTTQVEGRTSFHTVFLFQAQTLIVIQPLHNELNTDSQGLVYFARR